MPSQLSAVLYLSLLSFVAVVFTPAAGMIGGIVYTTPPEYLSAIIVYDPATEENYIICSATLISPYKALTSCYCANYAMLTSQSQQAPYDFSGIVYYAVGMTTLDKKEFMKQNASGMVYMKEITYDDIYCPIPVNLYDTTNYPSDIGVIDIGTVDTAQYGLKPVMLASDDPMPGAPNTFIEGWSSTTSCTDTQGVTRNYQTSMVVDCGQTKVPVDSCDVDEFCTKYPRKVQLTLGDTGGSQIVRMGNTEIQYGVTGRQQQDQPYGVGCTKLGAAQVNTKVSYWEPWIRKNAPFAKFTKLSSMM